LESFCHFVQNLLLPVVREMTSEVMDTYRQHMCLTMRNIPGEELIFEVPPERVVAPRGLLLAHA
jgi:hypothetical protein